MAHDPTLLSTIIQMMPLLMREHHVHVDPDMMLADRTYADQILRLAETTTNERLLRLAAQLRSVLQQMAHGAPGGVRSPHVPVKAAAAPEPQAPPAHSQHADDADHAHDRKKYIKTLR